MAAAGSCRSGCLVIFDLSVAEPLLATSLIFALLLAAPLCGRQPLRATGWWVPCVLSLGVTALSVARTVSSQGERFGSLAYWPTAAGIAVAASAVRDGGRRSGQQRADLTGCAAAGLRDRGRANRRTVQIADAHSLMALLTSWPVIALRPLA